MNHSEKRSALIVIPGAVNYFYNQAGRRLQEALQGNGWTTLLVPLSQVKSAQADGKFDWGFFVNVTDLFFTCGNETQSLLDYAKDKCAHTAQVLLECVTTKWFANAYTLGKEAGLEWMLDLGLHDQTAQLPQGLQDGYRFVFNGLTPVEAEIAQALDGQASRPIPWAFIGHQTSKRVELAYRLVQEFDAAGFFYLPELSHVTENGPHLNEVQFAQVLRHARYQIWASHHSGFYLEGERFRTSYLTGSVPIKVQLADSEPVNPDLPFAYLSLNEANFTEALSAVDFVKTRHRFAADFQAFPTLSQSLSAVLSSIA